MKILLAGDLFITRRIPQQGYPGFSEIRNFINKHDAKFVNLETTIHDHEGYPSLFPGGTYAMAHPNCLQDVKEFGFNLLNVANNHTMDYCHNGLLATIKHLNDHQFVFAGAGRTLESANAPAYLECETGRVALVGCTSSFHDSDAAGNQSVSMSGRPGVNPLRHKSVYELIPERFEQLESITNELGLNDYHNQAIKEGYLLPRKDLNIGSFEFVKGKQSGLKTTPWNQDLVRILKSVKEAKKQSDFVIVSLHSHQFKERRKECPPDFIREFAHQCIKVGANVVVGHGPHVLRGIELVDDGVVFYGLGNFLFQNETVSHLPADFYEKYSMPSDETVGSAMDKRSKNNTIGLATNPQAWYSVMPSIEYAQGRIKNIELHPIDLRQELPRSQRGNPVLSKDVEILNDIKELSFAYATTIELEGNHAKVTLR